MQNSLCSYELLKISVFCQKWEDNNILTKYSHCLTWSLFEKERATGNLRKLVCVVNNIQGIAVCCFTSNLWKTAGVNLLFATLVLLQIRNFCQKSRTFSKQRTLLLIYLNGLVRSQTFRHLEVCHFCAKQCAQQRNARNWSLKKVRFAVLGESSAKERAQCTVAWNWPQITLGNCRFASSWHVLLKRENLCKKLCATVLLLKNWCWNILRNCLKFAPCVRKLQVV